MIIYLYVKTHKITGLKYLGKTESRDPHKYKGSGKYWTSHLNVHGPEYTTEIIKECSSKEDLKYWGKYYSDLWNVVESIDWANLKEEVGDGGRQSEEVRKKISDAGKGRIPWNKGKHIWTPEEKIKIGERNKLRGPQSKETILKRVSKTKGKKRTAEQKKNISLSQKGKNLSEKHKQSLRGKRPQIIAHNRDHKKYTFIHKSGLIEKCSRTDLINKYHLAGNNLSLVISGKRKHHKGWSVIN